MSGPRAKPPCKHVVKQGEWLASIAASYGFKDWQFVWDAAENDALRTRRTVPEQLLPGDPVFIPALRSKTERCASGSLHAFVIDLGEMTIKLKLKDAFGEAIGNTEYEVTYQTLAGDGSVAGATDGSGALEAKLPMGAQRVHLGLPSLGQSIEIAAGHMDPDRDGEQLVTSGVLGRLANLGYPTHEGSDAAEQALAIQTYQRERMGRQDATGELDDATRQAIVDEYGC